VRGTGGSRGTVRRRRADVDGGSRVASSGRRRHRGLMDGSGAASNIFKKILISTGPTLFHFDLFQFIPAYSASDNIIESAKINRIFTIVGSF